MRGRYRSMRLLSHSTLLFPTYVLQQPQAVGLQLLQTLIATLRSFHGEHTLQRLVSLHG
jgi:hypothetical protein